MDPNFSSVGQWYMRRDTGELFQVTACDEQAGTIEIQTFDGDLDEIEDEAWKELPLVPIEAPEDWTGPLDNVEIDDVDGTAQGISLAPSEPLVGPWPGEELNALDELRDSGVSEDIDVDETMGRTNESG